MCSWNRSKKVEMDILTLSSSESQTLSPQNKSGSRHDSAGARKSRTTINMRSKQVSSSVIA